MGVKGSKTSRHLSKRITWFEENVGIDGLVKGGRGQSSHVKTRYHRPGSNRRK